MTTIVCIKVGTKYNADYVNRLESMVRRHMSQACHFVCLTDDPIGIRCETEPIDTDLPGWWSKLVLFKPHPALIGQHIIYIDLDTVIVDNIDFLCKQWTFCIIKDWWANTYNSSVMCIPSGFGQRIWTRFECDAAHLMNVYHGDQDWITTQVDDPETWQAIAPGKIGSYKADKLIDSPCDFSMVCFHGEPKPHTIEKGWVRDNWI